MWEESRPGSPAVVAPVALAGGLARLSGVRTGVVRNTCSCHVKKKSVDSRAIGRHIFFKLWDDRVALVCVRVCVRACMGARAHVRLGRSGDL